MQIVTAITAQRDLLKEKQTKGKYVAYLDTPVESSTWEVREAPKLFTDPRRNARYVKLMLHTFVDDVTIWIDGSIEILKDPQELVDKYLQDADIATFRHPDRDCLYKEARVCIKNGMDQKEVIERQTERYFMEGYPTDNGLAETKVVIRRNTDKVREFNEKWFLELTTNSKRDQISFPYIAWKTGIKVQYMEPLLISKNYDNGEFRYTRHTG